MYHTLNEGLEAMHKEIKEMASTSMKNIQECQTGDNCFQQVINHQSQQRALRMKGKAPSTYQLTQVHPDPPTPADNIAPPKFLPP